MTWDTGITGVHRAIAGSTHKRVVVLAGPGTGKTTFGLMRRVARLLEDGVDGKRILLLSFTRVAASDLRDKVAALGVGGADTVRATTLHSYCFGVLRRADVLRITQRTPRILLKHEVDLMLRDIGGDLGSIHDRRKLLEAMVAGWARNIETRPGAASTELERDFESQVEDWMRVHRAMLIGEVVPLVFQYLRASPHAAERTDFDHIVVDEYQDLNALEQRLLELLSEAGSLCVAGDDDQSIYSLRYANPDGILAVFNEVESESHVITACGRCPENILAMANSLIARTPGRRKAPLTTSDATTPGDIAIVQWKSDAAEVEGIVNAIAMDIERGVDPGEILVLTNFRKIGERVRAGLQSKRIDAHTFFTEEALESETSREVIALLRLLVDEHDAPALRVVLGIGDGTGRTAKYQELLQRARNLGTTPHGLLEMVASGADVGLRAPALAKRYKQSMTRLSELRVLSLDKLIDALMPVGAAETSGLRDLALTARANCDDVRCLCDAMIDAISHDSVPQSPDFVRIMSLHKSKGLTSHSVYIVGAVDGILPTIRDSDADVVARAMAEGRRLFYVALTRARRALTISYAQRMSVSDARARGVRFAKRVLARDQLAQVLPCPYIVELGPSAPPAVKGEDWLRGRNAEGAVKVESSSEQVGGEKGSTASRALR